MMQGKLRVSIIILKSGTRMALENLLCHFWCQVTHKGTKIYKNAHEGENAKT